jgi:ATP-dependent Lon protease
MRTLNPFETNGDPAEVSQYLKSLFTWLEPWSIQISARYVPIVERLCRDLEDIYGPKPKYRFLRITEETVRDEVFQAKLVLFTESHNRSQARLKAELQAINLAMTDSQQICKKCGSHLMSREVINEELLALMPHLELMNMPPYERSGYVCKHCLADDWQHRKREDSVTNTESESANGQTDAESRCDDGSDARAEILVVKPDDLKRIEDETKTGGRENVNRLKGILAKIQKQPLQKRLVRIPEQWRMKCQTLADDYPNFAEVVAFLRSQMALSAVSNDRVLRIAPFLLVGGAGIGKTDFMLTLADRLQAYLEIINISNAQTGCALTGAEQYWSNAQPGKLFNLIVAGEFANPLICLDEIDKARKDQSYDPLAALYQLLEPRQAARYTDLSLPDLPFDASHVLWMATANDIDAIPKPIVDRFAVFEIEEPNRDQSRIIVQNQYRRFVENDPAGAFFDEEPSPEVVEALSRYHPRQVRKTLQQCFGVAAFDERSHITIEDVLGCAPVSVGDTNRIGFLAEL